MVKGNNKKKRTIEKNKIRLIIEEKKSQSNHRELDLNLM